MILQKEQRPIDHIQLFEWNVENLFHPTSGGPRLDMTAKEGWTRELFNRKCQRLASVIDASLSPTTDKRRSVIVALSEVENIKVLKNLLRHCKTPLKIAIDPDFSHPYLDSAIVYDPKFLKLESCRYLSTFGRFQRGDVVRATFKIRRTDTLITVYACHLKARPPANLDTELYRRAVCDNIQTEIWRSHNGPHFTTPKRKKEEYDKLPLKENIVVMGDFNDEPFSPSLMTDLCATYDSHYVEKQEDLKRVAMYNTAWEKLHATRPGSLYYGRARTTKWSMLDQIILSPALVAGNNKLKYRRRSFKVIQNLSHDRDKAPFSCLSFDQEGNVVWRDGFSDHFPVSAILELCD